jgi:hypothetical protein
LKSVISVRRHRSWRTLFESLVTQPCPEVEPALGVIHPDWRAFGCDTHGTELDQVLLFTFTVHRSFSFLGIMAMTGEQCRDVSGIRS